MTVGAKLKQTIAGLKNARGTLRMYANQSRKEETRDVFREAVAALDEVLADLETRLAQVEFEEPQYKGL